MQDYAFLAISLVLLPARLAVTFTISQKFVHPSLHYRGLYSNIFKEFVLQYNDLSLKLWYKSDRQICQFTPSILFFISFYMDMQHLFLVGRATAEPVLLESKNNSKFAKFSIAVNEFSGGKEAKTTFFDILVFGKSSETAVEKVKKGDKLLVQGKLEVDSYISKKDKQPKSSLTVLADSWKLLK